MKKLDFFLMAMRAEEYRRTAWVISAFSLISEGPDDWKKNPYPYRIVQTATGHFFVDPDNGNQLSPIEGSVGGEPVFSFKGRVKLPKGMLPNLDREVETTYGNVLANYILLIYPFGKKFPFRTGKFSATDIEAAILPRLQDTPEEGAPREDKYVYVDEYLKFADAAFYLVGFSQLCVPAHTPKSMTTHPDMIKRKNELYEKYKDQLKDQSVIALIGEELQKLDAEWLKGDESLGFLDRKSMKVVRPKLYQQMGTESGLSDSIEANPIKNSLEEGWDITKFADMNNNLRAGSFNRGAQTMLGGESVKWLLRASSNITITEDDCGSTMGNLVLFADEKMVKKYTGFSVINSDGSSTRITEDNRGTYIGKAVRMRTPMFCKLDKTDYCKTCVGERMAANPTGASMAISEIGSVLLLIFMKKMHGTVLATQRWDWQNQLT